MIKNFYLSARCCSWHHLHTRTAWYVSRWSAPHCWGTQAHVVHLRAFPPWLVAFALAETDAIETGDRCGQAEYNGAWWRESAIKPRCILPFIREWLLPEHHSTHGHCYCINLQYQRQNYKSGKYWNIHFCKEMSCSYLDFFSQFHRQSSVCSIATYLWKIQRL